MDRDTTETSMFQWSIGWRSRADFNRAPWVRSEPVGELHSGGRETSSHSDWTRFHEEPTIVHRGPPVTSRHVVDAVCHRTESE